MSTPQTAPSTGQKTSPDRTRRIVYNTALGLSAACPVVALLPPRKLDLFTMGLGVCWCLCISHVVEERTGRGLMWHIGSSLPGRQANSVRDMASPSESRVEGEGEHTQKPRGLVGRLWMGGEKDNWVEERARKEREALEEGRGYGGLIMDQLKDVWDKRPFRSTKDDDSDDRTGSDTDTSK